MGFIKDTFLGGAEEKAGQTQAAAADTAVGTLEGAGAKASGRLDKFTGAGEQVLNPLVSSVLAGPESDFERTQGFEKIQKSAAAGGKLRSGETLKGLTEFSSGLDTRNFNNRVNQLLSIAGLGANSAAAQSGVDLNTGLAVADTQVGKGDALASAIMGKKNARIGTINDLASIATGSKFLDDFKSTVPSRVS
jgi:hypothetical protein